LWESFKNLGTDVFTGICHIGSESIKVFFEASMICNYNGIGLIFDFIQCFRNCVNRREKSQILDICRSFPVGNVVGCDTDDGDFDAVVESVNCVWFFK